MRSSSSNLSESRSVDVSGETAPLSSSELQGETKLVSSEHPCSGASVKQRAPFLLELFCGSAGVTAQFIAQGGRALGMDHVLNKARMKGPAAVDLSSKASQKLVMKEIRDGRVDACLLAPPYGTLSRALRTAAFPEGVPRLSGLDRLRVRQANKLYSFCQQVFQACVRHQVLCIVEGPATSRVWETKWFTGLTSAFHFEQFDACMYGSAHFTQTALLTTAPLPHLRAKCNNRHHHAPWNARERSEMWTFKSAGATQYTALLCKAIVTQMKAWLESHGKSMQECDSLKDHAAAVQSHKRPRHTRGPLLLQDFKTKVHVQVPLDMDLPPKIPDSAPHPLQGLPFGSKLLSSLLRGDSETRQRERQFSVCVGHLESFSGLPLTRRCQ